MEKNVFQKAKEYGLIDGYIPVNSPSFMVDYFRHMADSASKEEDLQQVASIFRDAAAIIELHTQHMEMIVNAYEGDNPPRKIEVLGKA
ncbi:MAG: hypothetical protein IKV17_07670 [Bacteroidaceae bacterium]|nr:hypothetical protein [Bacteroidaceae bacterium]